jgi:hypothetical protein
MIQHRQPIRKAQQLPLCRGCPGPGSVACGLNPECPSDKPSIPTETVEEVRTRKQGERWARWLNRYARWLRPVVAAWFTKPLVETKLRAEIRQLVNAEVTALRHNLEDRICDAVVEGLKTIEERGL